ncbi:MAG: hypothetical protein J0L96_21360 [Anaerolineae bacterium]|nr:hypothetical protein [Anaerolineae bacterium]
MKKMFLLSVVVSMVFTACGVQRNAPTTHSSPTPEPSSTPTSTFTLTPTRIQPTKLPFTPTFTPFPTYQNKGVIFDYYVIGNQAYWDEFFDPPSGNILTKLVLYDDGQMLIAGTSEAYKQKVLSSTEIKGFLSKLESLGFYSLESTQKHDPTDDLYNFEGRYEEVGVFGGLRDCILVNAEKSRNLCIHDSYLHFLIPEMKKILQYLDTYQPAGMTSYYPDRILLTIQSGLDSSIEYPPAIPWDERFPSLGKNPKKYTSGTSNQVVYIDGDMAKEIFSFFEGSESSIVVSQNGNEYLVDIRVLLPHEKVKNP